MESRYWGKVVDISDDTKSGRIRVAVNSVYQELPVDVIPWALPRYQNRHSHNLPELGSNVEIIFFNDDIMYPLWWQSRGEDNYHQLSDDDYESAIVIVDKNLSNFANDEGHVRIEYTKTGGYAVTLTKDDNTSIISIRADNSVYIKNGKTEQLIHISNDSISLGSETASAEPGVLGDTNVESLNKLNDFVDELSSTINSGLQNMSIAAGGSPYTIHMKPVISALKTQITLTVKKWHSANSKYFEKTKSRIVTLD